MDRNESSNAIDRLAESHDDRVSERDGPLAEIEKRLASLARLNELQRQNLTTVDPDDLTPETARFLMNACLDAHALLANILQQYRLTLRCHRQ